MQKEIIRVINTANNLRQSILQDDNLLTVIEQSCKVLIKAFRNSAKVLFCGNGGSASDAQHLAAELSGRFYLDRAPLFAEALHVNTSYLTAVANDYSFDDVFSRLLKGKGQKGDVLVSLSTSGNSKNVLRAMEVATELEMINIAFTGQSGGKMRNSCDYLINVPSQDTARIQEAHILIGHIICEIVERELFSVKGKQA